MKSSKHTKNLKYNLKIIKTTTKGTSVPFLLEGGVCIVKEYEAK